jgi:hypothetical protein
MAKLSNELDLVAVQTKLTKSTKANWEKVFAKFTDTQQKVLDKLISDKAVKCHIFTGSVTFRNASGSVKNLPIKPTGFKGGISKSQTAIDVFLKTVYTSSFDPSVSVDKFIIACAFYFLIYQPDRVKTESDKTEAAEGQQVKATQSVLKLLLKEHGEIRLKIGDNYYTIDEFDQYTAGRPKADATFKYKGTDVVFLSLKKGSKAGDFQQYGGSTDLGLTTANMNQFPEVQEFANKIETVCAGLGINKTPNGYDFWDLKKGAYFGYPLREPKVAATVMFGKDFGSTKFGINNCNCTIDGDIVFKKTKSANIFELQGQYHISINPYEYKTPKYPAYSETDIYAPILFLAKANNVNHIGFIHARFYIWPQNNSAKTGIKNLEDAITAFESKDPTRINAIKIKYL